MSLLQEIQVPLLAVNDTTLTVVEVNYTSGSPVKKGDVVMVFETSKTTYDVEAQADGYIHYLCQQGNDYEVNTIVANIYSEAGEIPATTAQPSLGGPSGLNGQSGLNGPSVLNGQSGTNGQPSLGPQSGIRTAPAGVNGTADRAPVRAFALPGQGEARWEGEPVISREAARLMSEAGLAATIFAGRDFVSAQDVQQLLQPPPAVSTPARTAKSGPAAGPTLPVDLEKVIVQRLGSGKKREIEYLSDVQTPGLTSTLNIFVETDGIFTHINRTLKYLRNSLLPVIVYEVSRLLADYPLLNAYFTGDAIARYKDVNPGFAVDIDKGLKVLKIAGAGKLSIQDIESRILQMSGQYLDDTLDIEQLTDITFTITDLSSEGVAFFRPLVNKMNSAILGVSAIDGKLQRCTLSLTFDHRVTEGKLAAQFLKELKERLETYRAVDAAAIARDISCFKCLKTLREDLSGVGFARCVTPEGKDGYICQSCSKGF